MTDLEFVQRCVSHDKSAWDEFVERYSRLIYNYIHSVLSTRGQKHADVQDIFQDIFVLLSKDNFKKLRSFKAKNGCSLATWLRQVTVNFTIDYCRKFKPLISIDEEPEEGFSLKELLADDAATAPAILSDKERLKQLKECIGQLDNEAKFFLELHFYRQVSLQALKELFRASRGAIDMRKYRISEQLKECFRSKGFQLD